MPESRSRDPQLIRLGKLANHQRFDELETAWLEVVEQGEIPLDEMIPIVGQVGRLGEPDKAGSLLALLLESAEARGGAAAGLVSARLAAAELPRNSGLRETILRLLLVVHGDYPDLELLLQRLCPEECALDEAVVLIEAYLRLRAGTYVADRSFIEPGRIEAVDGRTATVTVQFTGRSHDYGIHKINTLAPLPADHFPALLLYDPDRLRELASERPVAFIQLALQAQKSGRLAYRDLKRQVTTLLGEKGWTAWWKKAKPLVKRAPSIEMSSGSQPTFRKMRVARSYEKTLRAEFDAERMPANKLAKIFGYLDETAKNEAVASDGDATCTEYTELLTYLGNAAAKLAVAALAESPALALAGLAAHAQVAARGVAVAHPNPKAAAQVLKRLDDPSQLALELVEALLSRTLAYLRDVMPSDWPEIWAAVLPRAGRRSCDVIVRALVEQNATEPLAAAFTRIVARPTGAPEAVCWLWRARHSSGLGKQLMTYPALAPEVLLSAVLVLADATGRLHAISQEESHRKILELARQVLLLQDGQPVRTVFADATTEEAKRFKTLIEHNAGLVASGRGQLLGLLRAEHDSIFLADLKPWEDDAIYTSKNGLRKRQAALDKILTEEIPAVAKQIGEAAAFGDLSENAEFTAALEKRDQLTSRATMMENDLQRAQVITAEMAASVFVCVGTRITARNLDSGEEETYTFLGPWDSEPEEGILAYQAPLSMAFMGKQVGEEVVYGEDDERRRWEVLSVEPGI
ncbi:MAG: GreA/GreB family elongation factor [bacterium]